MRKLMFAIAALLGTTGVVLAMDAVFVSETAKATIEIASLPGHDGKLFVVGWRDVTNAPPTGALVFAKTVGGNETTYLAVGGNGPFAIIDRGRRTLVEGTIVPVVDVIVEDPNHPRRMHVARGKSTDAAALTARYHAFEHVAGARETQAAIEGAVATRLAAVNKTCAAKLATKIAWSSFTKDKRLAYAKQTIAVLDAVEPLCADADYRAAIQKLAAIEVDWRAAAKNLVLAVRRDTLVVGFSATAFNPRETAGAWLTDNL